MQLPLKLRTYPFQLLLYLEWSLLGILAISEAVAVPFPRLSRSPLLNFLCLLVFGLMGLTFPQRVLLKIIYTTTEFGLILLATVIGGIRLVPLFYLVLVLRNSLIFEGVTRSAVTGLAIGLCLLNQVERNRQFSVLDAAAVQSSIGILLLGSGVLMGLTAIFMQLTTEFMVSERRNREQLAITNAQLMDANAQLRDYTMKAETHATTQERNRVAREIHDSLGHALTILNLHLEAALKLWQTDPAEATEFLQEAKHLGSHALQEVRRSVAALRVDPLQDKSLQEAIQTLIEEFQRSTGITPICYINLSDSLPNILKTPIYRTLQEALTNIYKHAGASEVRIQIHTTTTHLHLLIQDDGCGFDPNQTTSGFGLQGVGERILAINGKLDIMTAPTQGCKIQVCLPLPEPSSIPIPHQP